MNVTECNKERKYIESINPQHPGDTFNNDPNCFKRYCKMQADAIEKAKYLWFADCIRRHVKK